jgi:uncharacterized protein YecE (DUF72 family)
MAGGVVAVGISGYDYRGWRGRFYPETLPRSRWLAYAAQHFDSIELNGTFYSLKSPAVYRGWVAEAGPGYVFAVKGSRYITHLRRLREPRRALANFYASGVLALGRGTGPFLWQLPPRFRFDAERLEAFLSELPRDSAEAASLARGHDDRLPTRALLRAPERVPYRHALEVRDPSFCVPAAYALLRRYRVALVVADTGGRYPAVEEPTADFVYARLHGPRELYASGSSEAELDGWAARVSGWADGGRDVYVYFDNDAGAHAPFDATGLARRVAIRRGGASGSPPPDRTAGDDTARAGAGCRAPARRRGR